MHLLVFGPRQGVPLLMPDKVLFHDPVDSRLHKYTIITLTVYKEFGTARKSKGEEIGKVEYIVERSKI